MNPKSSKHGKANSIVAEPVEEAQYKTILINCRREFSDSFEAADQCKEQCELSDFDLMFVLGEGAFGQVILIQHKKKGEYFAMKVLEKMKVVKTKQIVHTRNEKRVLLASKFPNLVKMSYFISDNSNLYFIMQFVNGGDLFSVIQQKRSFEDDLAQFYAAQVLLGLEYLHFMEIVYRDLKPENILLDHRGYIKITDFGFCKKIRGRTYTLCGTPEYLAPEMILNKGYGKYADWWSFGVLIFEFSCGYSPFVSSHGDGGDHVKLYENIVKCRYKVPHYYNKDLKDLIGNLLQLDVTRRFGNLKNGIRDIKEHAWFQSVSFLSIYNQTISPPYKPPLKGMADITQCDSRQKFVLKVSDQLLYEDEFKNF